jgi:uncharacterized membrane protein
MEFEAGAAMPSWLSDILFPIARWLHIVCMTLIVGGTLFFELVLPVAIEDLKREQQLYVFARARWVFRWVVWLGAVGLLISGLVGLHRMWQAYQSVAFAFIFRWAVAHMVLGAIALAIALLLTIGRRPPEDPVRWMRLNLVILLVVIFLGAATRHFQLVLREQERQQLGGRKGPEGLPAAVDDPRTTATTQPAATQGTEP